MVFGRRHVLKLAAVSTGVVGGSGGMVQLTSAPVAASAANTFSTSTKKIPPNSLEYIRFDGDTEFTVTWDDLIRGEVIELIMAIRLESVVDGDGNTVGTVTDGFDDIGQMGIRVDKKTGSKTVSGREFFENRDYIAVTEKSDIDPETVDVFPRDDDDIERVSTFTIRVYPVAPGLSSGDYMEWTMKLKIEADMGFGYYFGEFFGVVN
jgi:hypothetical protein